MMTESNNQDTGTLEPATCGGPWLIELGHLEQSERIVVVPGQKVVIGSGPEADIRIGDRTVSGRHCVVTGESQGLVVRDLGSRNGTYVGAARVGEAWLPGAGECFVVGQTTVTVRTPVRDDDLDEAPLPGLVGRSPAMKRVAREVRRYAPLRAPVLIRGESGTGKDVVAQALHRLSGRRGNYLPMNVGAVAESLADAEIFGHQKGAFTGAIATRPGAFQQADNGTLFLDEIAELAPSIQVKLLRVVEDGQIRPVGGACVRRANVRLVSATWAHLEEQVALGRFRADLFHRLSTVVIELPPLRARKGDIGCLARTLLERMRDDFGRRELSGAALSRLVSYNWPGNVRELASVLYRAAACAAGPLILPEHIDIAAIKGVVKPQTRRCDVKELLRQHEGNVSAAARAAGVPRSTYRAWLAKAG